MPLRTSLAPLLLIAPLLGTIEARAQPAGPTVDTRIAMLGDYAQALGRRFACNSNEAQMVTDIKRFTYGLQLDDDASGKATDTVKQRLTAGIGEARANAALCPDAEKGVTALEAKLRSERGLMEEASKTVTALGGAALACGIPPAQVQTVETAFWTYSKTDDEAEYGSKRAAWTREGDAEVKTNAIACDSVKSVFGQVEAMFAP